MPTDQREQIQLSLGRLRRYKIRALRDFVSAGEGTFQEWHAQRRLMEFKQKQVELYLLQQEER